MAQEAAMSMESQVKNASSTKKPAMRNNNLLLDNYIDFLALAIPVTLAYVNSIRSFGFTTSRRYITLPRAISDCTKFFGARSKQTWW
ncbi:hypothetical protein PIB30_000606 [Stylosanthes scabra]|uniref:Uncharacterized protein n=1 Tax=Stylosanthes scabra TaxID=79078 RepID=A0ABU6X054_9FABA|nr:hypothetical protein [Stylosanthes scabra]